MSTSLVVNIDQGYISVLFVALMIAAQYVLTSLIVGKARSRAFNAEFMSQFNEDHAHAFPGEVPNKEGYPDCGQGRYSDKLPYKDWYDFNNAQRIHYNFLEAIHVILTWLVIAGVAYPWYAVVGGSVYFVGRLVYIIGYSFGGPNGRFIGVLIHMLAALFLFGLSIASPIKMLGYNKV